MSGAKGKCKLCGCHGKLVKCSHVIPLWMYSLLPNDGKNFKIISPLKSEYEIRSQSGEYASFVCQLCEDRFKLWDDYAAKVLRNKPQITTSGIDFGSYDYSKLKRFYLSVLWRMSAYGRPLLSIDLGNVGESLGSALLDDENSNLSRYEVIPSCSDHILSLGVLEPRIYEIDGIPYWKIYMPRFQALINVSGTAGSDRLMPWQMSAGTNLRMLDDRFECGEMDLAMHTFRTNMEQKNVRCH